MKEGFMMKTGNKFLILCLAATLALPFTALAGEDTSGAAQAPAEPVAVIQDGPKIFETQDGVLEMAAPTDNDNWCVIQDDQNWFAMSDGTDTITVDHYSNGDTLPAPEIADDTFVQIYQVYYSTDNEVFIVTGKVTVEGDMPYVKDSVNSFKVLKYDTLTPTPAPEPQPVYDIKAIGATMYCTTPDGVHVRADHSMDAAVIGGISYREAVYVIGDVTKDGVDTGWYQIQFGNDVAYVWEDWFDVNQPPADPVRTGDTMTIYSYDGSMSKEIYFYTDGVWRDEDGITYSAGMSAEVDGSDGSVWYESPMEEPTTLLYDEDDDYDDVDDMYQ